MFSNSILGFYVGLQGAAIYDVVGLKNIAKGYSIMCCAFGLSTLITISAAGNENLGLPLN